MVPIPKMGNPKDQSLIPISIMICKTIGLKPLRDILKVLFDADLTKSLISRKALPPQAQLILLSQDGL